MTCSTNPAASSVLGISHSVSIDGKHGLSLWQAGRVVDFTDPRLTSAFPQVQTAQKRPGGTKWLQLTCRVLCLKSHCNKSTNWFTHRVVEAWAIMLPPIGFLGSAENIAAPSTCATTWLVITTATPNCWQDWVTLDWMKSMTDNVSWCIRAAPHLICQPEQHAQEAAQVSLSGRQLASTWVVCSI